MGQVQFELLVVGEKEVVELLEGETVGGGFVLYGAGLEGHGLFERGVDAHLV